MTTNTLKEFTKRIEKNEVHYDERTTDDQLLERTKHMASICFLCRPACNACDLIGDPLYCPPAAAHKELVARGYERTIICAGGAGHKTEYKKSDISTDFAAMVW